MLCWETGGPGAEEDAEDQEVVEINDPFKFVVHE